MTRARATIALLAATFVASILPPGSGEAATLPLRVAVKGDWGAATAAQKAITDRMCAVRSSKPFSYVLTTGDNFYDPDGVATTSNYFTPESCLRSFDAHRWRASWGNHDVRGDSTRTELGAARYYTWSSRGVAFFMLDSNNATSSTQRSWLASKLKASGARIKIVAFHHPPYTVGPHAPSAAVRTNWVPLFERYNVSLVLSGHNHLYEHHRVRGVDYVVTGGAGAKLYPCDRTASSLIKCSSAHHFLLVYAATERVYVRAVRSTGTTLDYFSFSV